MSEILKGGLNSLSVSTVSNQPAANALAVRGPCDPDLGIPSSFKIQVVPFANGVNPGDTVGQSTTWYTKIFIPKRLPKVYHYLKTS